MRRVFLDESSTSVSSRGIRGSNTVANVSETVNGDMESAECWKVAYRQEMAAVLIASAVRPARHTRFGMITSAGQKIELG